MYSSLKMSAQLLTDFVYAHRLHPERFANYFTAYVTYSSDLIFGEEMYA